MRKGSRVFGIIPLIIVAAAYAQLPPWVNWTLIPAAWMDEIIGEASGESAWRTIADLAAYSRDRLEPEYRDLFFETKIISEAARRAGLAGVEIVRFPADPTWDGVMGELWELSPNRQKLASYQDMTAMLASGSRDADVTAELAWVGRGNVSDFQGVDVTGKIVVSDGDLRQVHNRACAEKGALGVIWLGHSPDYDDGARLPWLSLGSRRGAATGPEPKFAFLITPRESSILRERLSKKERITVRARVKAVMMPNEYQNVIAHIPGSDPDAGDIIFSAHLFEGLLKQSANDNASGSAAILEVGRTLQRLISDGRLPRPKRTIRFLWGPEFAGTEPWVRANRIQLQKTLCNINMDMVGEWLTRSGSLMTLSRTTYAHPHYINDVMENYYRYVGEMTRNRYGGTSRRILAPTGADEPFYYAIETHTGGSDHEVFNDWLIRVPGVSMAAWPDPWYHTSSDLPDKSDPTQLKRVAIIGAAAAYTIAAAGGNEAVRIAGEIAANAGRRLAWQLSRALQRIDQANASTLVADAHRARIYIAAAQKNETNTLETVRELAPADRNLSEAVASWKVAVAKAARIQYAMLDTYLRNKARALSVPPPVERLSAEEKRALGIIPQMTPLFFQSQPKEEIDLFVSLPEAERMTITQMRLPYLNDFLAAIDGRNTLLDLLWMAEAQYDLTPSIAEMMRILQILKQAGLLTGKGI